MKTNRKSILNSWYIWLFPLFAVLIAGWLFFQYFNQRGPTIEISFEDASSIRSDKTRVRFRGVTIGTVNDITLSEDGKSALAHVTLHRDAARFAVKGTRFWIVSPKVGFQGVSGLETIFEGTYIAVQPGPDGGEEETVFKGRLENENDGSENVRAFTLESSNVESITPGDNVSFRGLNVGTITNVSLSKSGQMGVVQIHIQNRYARLIRSNTAFWRKVGVQAKLGLFGSEVKVNSVDSILHGGVEFATPDPAGETAKPGTKFELQSGPPKGAEKWNPALN